MLERASQIAVLIGLLTSCSSFFPDIPGVFYEFWLPAPPSQTVCSDLSIYLADKFMLQIHSAIQPPKGQCVALMEAEGHFHGVFVSLASTMQEREVGLAVSQHGFGTATKPSKETEEFATQIAAAIHERLPDADVKQVSRKYGLFAP
jgi:hypothetical protein